MLQIYLYGTNEQGFLDIPSGTALDYEELLAAFDEDYSVGEYSLPVTILWTDNNRRLFNFAERLENFKSQPKYYRCDVYDNGFPELINAKITILEKVGSFSYRSGSFNASISGTRGLFGSLIQNKYLTDLKLGGVISWTDKTSREFAEGIAKGTIPGYPYITFAPVAIENFIQKDRADYQGEFLVKDTVNNILSTGLTPNAWVFGRPRSTNPTTAAVPGEGEYADYRTVPFFNLKFVVMQLFKENGFNVQGDFINDTNFDDVYIFNQYGIEYYDPIAFIDLNTSINPANHMPKVLLVDFMKAIFTYLNMYPVFTGANDVQLTYRVKDFTDRRILNITKYCADQFDSVIQNTDDQQGYTIDYKWDSADSFYSDRVKDITDKTLIATVATTNSLGTLDIGRQLTTNDIAYVQCENMYYCVADATSAPIKWDAYSEELGPFVKVRERTVDIDLSPLCTYVILNTDTGLYERQNMVGCSQPGSYRNNKNTVVLNDFGLRIFYVKKRTINGNTTPVSFNHNRDNTNSRIEPYSLALNNKDGIVPIFHEQWQDSKESQEIVQLTVQADQKLMQDMRNNNVYEIDNVLFFPYQIERNIPLDNSFQLYLVPL